MIPPRAGEITASHLMPRSFSASRPQTSAAMSVYCSRSAHWKNWRLCKPERRIKCPSSSAPVLRKRARRSLLMPQRKTDILPPGRRASSLARHKRQARCPPAVTGWKPVFRFLFPGIDRFAAFVLLCGDRDHLDLYQGALRQGGYLHGRAGRRLVFEVASVNLVHRLKIP